MRERQDDGNLHEIVSVWRMNQKGTAMVKIVLHRGRKIAGECATATKVKAMRNSRINEVRSSEAHETDFVGAIFTSSWQLPRLYDLTFKCNSNNQKDQEPLVR